MPHLDLPSGYDTKHNKHKTPREALIECIIEDLPKLESSQLSTLYKSIRRYVADLPQKEK